MESNSPLDEPSKAVQGLAKVTALILGPISTYAQGKAEASKIKSIATAEIEAGELKMRAAISLEMEMLRHQQNKEAILDQARSLLIEQERIKALPENFLDEPVEPDWLFRWQQFAQNVSDQEVQGLWAKVLVGEMNCPGKFSLQLLHLLSILRKSDANAFALLANYVWEDGHGGLYQLYNEATDEFLSKSNGMDYRFYSSLQSLGLIDASALLNITVKRGQSFSVYYSGNTYHFQAGGAEDRLHVRILTSLGKEMFSLCQPTPDADYASLFLKGLQHHELKGVKNLSDKNAPDPSETIPDQDPRWS